MKEPLPSEEQAVETRGFGFGSTGRLLLQAAGFVGGLMLFGWCIKTALSPENREQLAKLSQATPGQIAALLGLSAATLLLNGLMFWIALRPVQRVPIADHLATNALCTFLAFLPFKINVMMRATINNRRDKVPLLTIGAWFGVLLVTMLAVFGPILGASLLLGRVDWQWWAQGLGGAAVALGILILIARPFAGQQGLDRLHRLIDRLPVPLVGQLVRTTRFAQLHTAADMLANPGAVYVSGFFRTCDLLVMSLRFVVAGAIVGVGFGFEEAVLAAAAYYFIGMASPFGMLGTREAGTVYLAGALGLAASTGQSAEQVARSLMVLTLFITGTESIVLLVGAAFGVIWLRPDRLLKAQQNRESTDD